MRKIRQLVANRCHLAAIEARRSDQHFALPQLQALTYRLWPERRKQWTEYGLVLQRAQSREVELRDASEERIDALTRSDAEFRQHVSKAIRRAAQIRVGDVERLPPFAEPANGDPLPMAVRYVPVDGFISDVESAVVGQTVQLGRCRLPRSTGTRDVVVDQAGKQPDGPRVLPARG